MAGISYVFTISRVAEMLGEDEEWLDEISIQPDPGSPQGSRPRRRGNNRLLTIRR
jgi:hypothetical protein